MSESERNRPADEPEPAIVIDLTDEVPREGPRAEVMGFETARVEVPPVEITTPTARATTLDPPPTMELAETERPRPRDPWMMQFRFSPAGMKRLLRPTWRRARIGAAWSRLQTVRRSVRSIFQRQRGN